MASVDNVRETGLLTSNWTQLKHTAVSEFSTSILLWVYAMLHLVLDGNGTEISPHLLFCYLFLQAEMSVADNSVICGQDRPSDGWTEDGTLLLINTELTFLIGIVKIRKKNLYKLISLSFC